MEFNEYCKYITIKDKDGVEHPLNLTKAQWNYINFIGWCKQKNYGTSIMTLKLRGGKQYIQNLYLEWLGEQTIKCL